MVDSFGAKYTTARKKKKGWFDNEIFLAASVLIDYIINFDFEKYFN